MPFKIIRNDITKMQVDAIVNTANRAPVYGTGVDTAVYEAAGAELLLAERKKIGFLNAGDVAITPGFNLPCKYIIHAVSPLYIDGESGEEELLRSCYQKSLQLAKDNHCESIAFPLISTGSFGYPKEEGMRIAIDEISAFLLKNKMQVFLIVFDAESTRLGKNLYPDLEAYIDQNYVWEKNETEYGYKGFGFLFNNSEEHGMRVPAQTLSASVIAEKKMSAPIIPEKKLSAPKPAEDSFGSFFDEDFWEENESALKERMKHSSDTFQEYLLYLIESKSLTNAEVYKRAIITKQLFSKIKVNPEYHPDKATAMRLCVGAKLNLDETKDLLARAGYALSPCDKRDIIFSFFIEKKIYDMIEIDIVLEEQGLPCFIE